MWVIIALILALVLVCYLTLQLKKLQQTIQNLTAGMLNDINVLSSQLSKIHQTMHLIKSIEPLFHKYKSINEALKSEDTIQNTAKLEEPDAISKYAESVYMDMFKPDPYKELFSQDDRMTYLGGVNNGIF